MQKNAPTLVKRTVKYTELMKNEAINAKYSLSILEVHED